MIPHRESSATARHAFGQTIAGALGATEGSRLQRWMLLLFSSLEHGALCTISIVVLPVSHVYL
jgi:hypothetical protein